MNEAKFRVSRTNRPRCPVHDRLLRVETSRRQVAYCYCPENGCTASAKAQRFPVEAKRVVAVTAQR
jgi:hypothetical protein